MTTHISPSFQTGTPQPRGGDPGTFTDERLVATSKLNNSLVQKEAALDKLRKFEISRNVENSGKKQPYSAGKDFVWTSQKGRLSSILECPFAFWTHKSTGPSPCPPRLASEVYKMECASICSDMLDEPMAVHAQRTIVQKKIPYPNHLSSIMHTMECSPICSDMLDENMAEFSNRRVWAFSYLPSHLRSAMYEMECHPVYSDALDEPIAEFSNKNKLPFPEHLVSAVYEMECASIYSDTLDEPIALIS